MIADRSQVATRRESEDVHFQTTRNGGSRSTTGIIQEHTGNLRDLTPQVDAISVSRSRSLTVDLVAAALVPFLSIWLYEACNWVVLAVQGYSVSVSTVGWLPLGVAGVSSG
jgi:hypothetical protein